MTTRPLRWGMVGGGEGAFIGAVHRMAARLDGHFQLLAGVPSADPERARRSGILLGLAADRVYSSVKEMIDAEKKRKDGVEVVSIVTPNHLHFAQAQAFLDAGFHVICEKPLTTAVGDAVTLMENAASRGLLLGVTFNYSGYPLVRHARSMVRGNALGAVRVVSVEYVQEWLSSPLETTGNKQASWRVDPSQAGKAGCLGDIGTHAAQLAEFITGLKIQTLAADLASCVPGRVLDDNVHLLLRFDNGARGMLWASQVAHGHQNGLKIRVVCERGAIEWAQETPDRLQITHAGESPTLLRRGDAAVGDEGRRATRLPGGHPEGFIEAFAQLYTDYAEQIRARAENRAADVRAQVAPNALTGVRAAAFVQAALDSNASNGKWSAVDDTPALSA